MVDMAASVSHRFCVGLLKGKASRGVLSLYVCAKPGASLCIAPSDWGEQKKLYSFS